jgi:hypothetical protein
VLALFSFAPEVPERGLGYFSQGSLSSSHRSIPGAAVRASGAEAYCGLVCVPASLAHNGTEQVRRRERRITSGTFGHRYGGAVIALNPPKIIEKLANFGFATATFIANRKLNGRGHLLLHLRNEVARQKARVLQKAEKINELIKPERCSSYKPVTVPLFKFRKIWSSLKPKGLNFLSS